MERVLERVQNAVGDGLFDCITIHAHIYKDKVHLVLCKNYIDAYRCDDVGEFATFLNNLKPHNKILFRKF